MMKRRELLLGSLSALAGTAIPGIALAQSAPSAATIQRSLESAPKIIVKPEHKTTRKAFKKRRDLREYAPSIDIQAINFAFGSANIPRSEHWKVREIAIALNHMLHRHTNELFLIEGHTDAVGSRYSNQRLSERRAASLRRVLVRSFDVDGYALETVGFGEEYLIVPTPNPNWRNRRVTIRRITDFILQ